MDNVNVIGGSLSEQIGQIIKASDSAVRAAGKDAAKKTANDVAKTLKRTSPHKGGKYEKGWKVTYQDGGYIVHNSSRPGLTHLLENGHDLIAEGKKVGRTKAQPHIKPAEEAGIEEFVLVATKEIERRLKGI
jgi:hypothetical protein